MLHDISYYRKIQGTNGVENDKQAKVRAYRKNIQRDFQKSLNWESVTVNGSLDKQDLQIIPATEHFTKKIVTRPNEFVKLGDIILWREAYWIVNNLDADNQLGHSADMIQCNIKLRWQLEDGSIYEEYGWNKDASKYAFGEHLEHFMDTANFTMKAQMQLNEQTIKIKRGKRFLLGPFGEEGHPLAVEVSRVNMVTNIYEHTVENNQYDSGILEFTLHETQYREDVDNAELGIADYVPQGEQGQTDQPNPPVQEEGWF